MQTQFITKLGVCSEIIPPQGLLQRTLRGQDSILK